MISLYGLHHTASVTIPMFSHISVIDNGESAYGGCDMLRIKSCDLPQFRRYNTTVYDFSSNSEIVLNKLSDISSYYKYSENVLSNKTIYPVEFSLY